MTNRGIAAELLPSAALALKSRNVAELLAIIEICELTLFVIRSAAKNAAKCHLVSNVKALNIHVLIVNVLTISKNHAKPK